jgi:hypothetical protein
LARKQDDQYRFCIDYNRLDEVIIKNAYTLPQFTAAFGKWRGAKYLSTIDLKSAYWQVPFTDESKPQVTAFIVPGRGPM